MSQRKIITDLLGIQGWEIEKDGIEIEADEVFLRIKRKSGTPFRCSECGDQYLFAYDCAQERQVRDFPVWGRRSCLIFTEYRVNCVRCGVHVEKLDWLDKGQHQTLRYERYIAHLCDLLPVSDVAELEGLDKGTVYRIDKKWLQLREAQRVQYPVTYLGIDEIALKKGHKYATVFYDLQRREVIGMVKERKQRMVSRFFRRWGKENCKQVVAVCMDLWAAYRNSVQLHCRNAAVVFDKFHVYTYLSTAIDEVRRIEQDKAAAEGRETIKGSRWLWLKASRNLRRKEARSLEEIMALNQNLQKAYLLKEDFEQFYANPNAESAERFLKEWIERCRESKLKPFVKLAKRLWRWAEGILAYFVHRITNAVSEGINNKIKVLKRRSYGFHDHEYFFLKILNITGALPEIKYLNHGF